ncbi:hypothetical protein [Streptomyces sp. 061-3]|uniref:hypothetical protein n=1 Tax=Streptomyces sp. 061-3 TaxID=2789268 RepID=UPI0039805AB9
MESDICGGMGERRAADDHDHALASAVSRPATARRTEERQRTRTAEESRRRQ